MDDGVKTVCGGPAARFLLALLVWLIVSSAWGVVGVILGPGIVMLIVAFVVAAFGTLASLMQSIFCYKLGTIYSGLLISISSLAVIWLFLSHGHLTYREFVFFAIFVSIPSFLVSFLVERFILLDKR